MAAPVLGHTSSCRQREYPYRRQLIEAGWIGALNAARLTQELIITFHLAAGRQRAPLGSDTCNMPAEFNFFDQKGIPRFAVGRTFIRLRCFAVLDEPFGWLQ
jgi:hypothetical protein